ncbi:PfkB family carbohydrate kinase [Thalassiella azotivora]
MHLTEREQQVLALLRQDPLIGSEAIAERLGTTRAAVNVHLSNLTRKGAVLGRGYVLAEGATVVVVGGSNLDVKARTTAPLRQGTSNPGRASMAPGGVGRNVAENLARLGTTTLLVSSVGRDAAGETVLAQTIAAGVRVEHVHRTDRPTGSYVAVLDDRGELHAAVSDMAATADLRPEHLTAAQADLARASLLVVDGNVSPAVLDRALDLAHAAGVRVVLEPVSAPKAAALAPHVTPERPLHAVTPNRDELEALTGQPTRTRRQLLAAADALHARGVALVWVRLGDRGSLLSEATGGTTTRTDLPALPTAVEDVTGAGDAMLSAFCHALLEGESPVDAARLGHAAAALTIASPQTVRPDLTPRLLRAELARHQPAAHVVATGDGTSPKSQPRPVGAP